MEISSLVSIRLFVRPWPNHINFRSDPLRISSGLVSVRQFVLPFCFCNHFAQLEWARKQMWDNWRGDHLCPEPWFGDTLLSGAVQSWHTLTCPLKPCLLPTTHLLLRCAARAIHGAPEKFIRKMSQIKKNIKYYLQPSSVTCHTNSMWELGATPKREKCQIPISACCLKAQDSPCRGAETLRWKWSGVHDSVLEANKHLMRQFCISVIVSRQLSYEPVL